MMQVLGVVFHLAVGKRGVGGVAVLVEDPFSMLMLTPCEEAHLLLLL